jgi:hypothetical protein
MSMRQPCLGLARLFGQSSFRRKRPGLWDRAYCPASVRDEWSQVAVESCVLPAHYVSKYGYRGTINGHSMEYFVGC